MFGTARSGYNPFPGMGPPRPVIHHMLTPAATRRLSSSADLPKWARSRANSADSGIQVDAALPASTQMHHRRTLPGPELTSTTRWHSTSLEPINSARPDTSGSAFLQQDNKLHQSMEYEKMESVTRNGGVSPSYAPLPPVQQQPVFEPPMDSTQRQAASNDADQVPRESAPAETGNTAEAGDDLRPWRAPGETDIFNKRAVFGVVPFVPQPKSERPAAESPRRAVSASPRQTADRDDGLTANQEQAPLDPPPWRNPGETDIFNRGAVFGVVPFVPQPKSERPAAESPRRAVSASPRQTADRDDGLTAKQEPAPLDPPPWRNPGETDIFNRGAVFGVVRSVPQPKFDQPENTKRAKPASPKGRDDHTAGQQTNEPGEPKIWRRSETTNFNKGAMFHVVQSVKQPDFQRETDNSQSAKHPDQTGGDRDYRQETQQASGDIQPAQAPVVWKGAETGNFNKGAMFHVVQSVKQPDFQRETDNPQSAKHPDQTGGDRGYRQETQEAATDIQPAQAPVVWKGAETGNFNKGAMFHVVQSVKQPDFQRETDNSQSAKHPDQTGGDRGYKQETQEAATNIQPAQAPVVWKGAETGNFNKGAMFHVVSSVPQPTFSKNMDNSEPDPRATGQDGVDATQGHNKADVRPPSQHVHWRGAETTNFNNGAVFNTVQSVPPPRYMERSTQEQGKLGEGSTKTAEGKENVITSPETAREQGQETHVYNRGAVVEEEQTKPTHQGGSAAVPPVTPRAWAGRSAHGRDTSRPVLEPLRPTQPATGAKRPPTKWTTSYSGPPSSGRGILRTMNDNVTGPPAGRSSPESKLPRLDSAGKPKESSSRLRRSRYGSAGGGLTAVDDTVPLPEPSRQAPLTKAVRLRRAVDLPNARCLFNVEGSGSDPWKAGRHSKGKRPFPKSEYVSSFQRWFPSRHYQGSKSAWAHRAGSANSERGFAQPLPDIGGRNA
ncbi:uncharacterized protein LOC144921853 isoform X1 [Branchiostoma floridae x Branchiostoma belcheri]